MTGVAAGVVLGFLVATAYGSAFHLLLGGPARRIPLYLFAAWLGFALGHFAGDWLDLHLLKLGAVNLFSASVGAWLLLLLGRWLVED